MRREGGRKFLDQGGKNTGSDARDHVTGAAERYCVNLRGVQVAQRREAASLS